MTNNIVHPERGKLDYPYGEASNDEGILAAVLNALHHNSGVPNDHIRAKVTEGHVVLTGSVVEEYERTLAEQAAAAVTGVIAVDNHITLAS